MLDLNKLTVNQLKKELELLQKEIIKKQDVWKIGKHYVIRTVTMINVGKLTKVTDKELVLQKASWIADTGRWHDFLSNGTYEESEPFPDGDVIIGRGSIIDATIWKHDSIRKVK